METPAEPNFAGVYITILLRMKYISKQTKVRIRLQILKEASKQLENLSNMNFVFFLYHGTDREPIQCTIDEENYICTPYLEDFAEETIYGVKLFWYKNTARFPHACCLMRVDVPNLFVSTEGSEVEVTSEHCDITMKVRSHVFGFDGLDSYELAVLSGKTTLSSDKWVANLSEMNTRLTSVETSNAAVVAAETQRQSTFLQNEGNPNQPAKSDGSRWQRFFYSLGLSTDTASSTGSMWARFKSSIGSWGAEFVTALGESTDTPRANGSMWARFLHSLGLNTDSASSTGSMWARFKYSIGAWGAEFVTALGESSDTPRANGSMWARFLHAIGARTDARSSEGSMWARLNDVIGDSLDRISDKFSMWAYFWSHIGANTDAASSNGTMWARFKHVIAGFTTSYNNAEVARNTAYGEAEAGRTATFNSHETTRDNTVSTAISEVKESLKETTSDTYNWITDQIVQANTSVRSEWLDLLAGDKIETLTNEGVPEGANLEFIIQSSAGTYSTEPYYRPYTAVADCKVAMYVDNYSAFGTAKGTLKLTVTRTVVQNMKAYEDKTDEHVQKLESEMVFYRRGQYTSPALDPLTTACLEAKDDALAAAEEARAAAANIPDTSTLASKTYVSGLVGVLSNLTTTVKTNVVAAINELKTLISGKVDISDFVNVDEYAEEGKVLPKLAKGYYIVSLGQNILAEQKTLTNGGLTPCMVFAFMKTPKNNGSKYMFYYHFQKNSDNDFAFFSKYTFNDVPDWIREGFNEDLRTRVSSIEGSKADKSEVTTIGLKVGNLENLQTTAKDNIVDALNEVNEKAGQGGGGSVAQIQSDWTQTDTTKKDYIRNKPTIPSTAYDDSFIDCGISYHPVNGFVYTSDQLTELHSAMIDGKAPIINCDGKKVICMTKDGSGAWCIFSFIYGTKIIEITLSSHNEVTVTEIDASTYITRSTADGLYQPVGSYATTDALSGKQNTANVVTDTESTTYSVAVDNSQKGEKVYKLGTLSNLAITSVGASEYETIIFFAAGASGCEVAITAPYDLVGDIDTSAEGEYVISILNGCVVCGTITNVAE